MYYSNNFIRIGQKFVSTRDSFFVKVCGGAVLRHTTYQRCRWVFKSGWASSDVVGIICPLVLIGLTEPLNSGWAKAHPAHPLAASLPIEKIITLKNARAWVSMDFK